MAHLLAGWDIVVSLGLLIKLSLRAAYYRGGLLSIEEVG